MRPSDHTPILLLAHGTPDVLGEMAEYLGKVTGGRPLPQHVVEELQHRYAEIGLGETPGAEPPPLTRWTMRQGELLEQAMGRKVYVGMRNWHPFIADVVGQMRAGGVTRFRAVCLAPQNSRTSVGLYRCAVMEAAQGMEVGFVAGWADHPLLVDAFAERLQQARAVAGGDAAVLFTAHSVPTRTVEGDNPDPYAREAQQTAALVAERAGVGKWAFAFQSQGVAGGPWIGPTVEDSLKALRKEGETSVVIQPIGFLCDNVEVLYDFYVAFQQTARELELMLYRAESLNDSPTLVRALADVAARVE